ncbi:hypothetical protein DM48_314 [Burkholderia gladioli]|uniref:Uncharacterized protein n=1 Tax=Burkholderia gladioli TaxID=28095 RepID=A0AAW3F4P2_BURGA|nr:hypothetical protein [Burkholderia gladioli]KGC15473.1 hypothetical protein DM48_314 [Burkholderia gladioli]
MRKEQVVTAYAEFASGPGWSNRPLWVIVRDENGKLREECIQPEEQTRDMHLMFRISYEAHSTMRDEAQKWLDKRKRKEDGK